MYSLDDEIRKKGGRGGTYITDDWLMMILDMISKDGSKVTAGTLKAVDYLRNCQEKADSYDWTEYFEQIPKIDKLYGKINSVLQVKST